MCYLPITTNNLGTLTWVVLPSSLPRFIPRTEYDATLGTPDHSHHPATTIISTHKSNNRAPGRVSSTCRAKKNHDSSAARQSGGGFHHLMPNSVLATSRCITERSSSLTPIIPNISASNSPPIYSSTSTLDCVSLTAQLQPAFCIRSPIAR